MTGERISDISNICIVGGAGFIGSHFVDRLLGEAATESVMVFSIISRPGENGISLSTHEDPRLSIVRGDVSDLECTHFRHDGD